MAKDETYYLLIEDSDEADVAVVYASTNNEEVKKMKTKMERHYEEEAEVDYAVVSFNPSRIDALNEETIRLMKEEDEDNNKSDDII